MKLVALVLAVAACGGPQSATTAQPAGETPTTSTDGTTSSPTSTVTTSSSATVTTSTSSPTQAASPTAGKAGYSCFSYGARDSRHSACSRTTDCDTYREQAKTAGVIDVSGCSPVDTVFCFGVGGEEVCQPTLESCTAERKLLLKKGTSVQSDCARG